MFGVGIEVGSPVYNGEVMPHLTMGPRRLSGWQLRYAASSTPIPASASPSRW